MRVSSFRFRRAVSAFVFTVSVVPATALMAQQAQPLASGTTIPVRFSQTLTAQRSKPGDAVRAVTTQPIQLADGKRIAAGAQVLGSVVATKTYQFDAAPYAHQQPSSLAIRFTEIRTTEGALPLHVTVRAVASASELREAEQAVDTDGQGPLTESRLIGGPVYSTLATSITSASGDVIAYKNAGGIVGRLLPSVAEQGELSCDASASEQAVGPFAPSACGAYGFDGAALVGGTADSSFTLLQPGYQARIDTGSAALLETL
jgi:hypothetical protein